jgi:predicted deacylase
MHANSSGQAFLPFVFGRTSWVRASRAGLLALLVGLGDNVREGQIVARVVDVFGNLAEEVPAPTAGTVFAVRRSAVVDVGDQVVKVAR